MCVCVRVCVCVCVREREREFVRARARARACVCVYVCVCVFAAKRVAYSLPISSLTSLTMLSAGSLSNAPFTNIKVTRSPAMASVLNS